MCPVSRRVAEAALPVRAVCGVEVWRWRWDGGRGQAYLLAMECVRVPWGLKGSRDSHSKFTKEVPSEFITVLGTEVRL